MFEREHHVRIAAILEALDPEILRTHACYFGGGTAIALTFGEYRESRDIDFLVSDPDGYRALRALTTQSGGLQSLARVGTTIDQARDIRADQYGIRTVVSVGGSAIKFEIVREANIAHETPGPDDVVCGVSTLTRLDMLASKLLANSDRWSDAAVLNRDVIDIAMMQPPKALFEAAIAKADAAYGTIRADLAKAVAHLVERPDFLEKCRTGLSMSVPKAVVFDRIERLGVRRSQ